MRTGPLSFLQHVDLRGALADLPQVFREAGPHRWSFLALAAAITVLLISPFWKEGGRVQPRPPHITYINTLPPGRSDAEIMRENIANQQRQNVIAARYAERQALVKRMYMALGRASGIDVDKIDREAQAEKRAEQAKQAAAQGPAPASR